jgi:hypothetical protein
MNRLSGLYQDEQTFGVIPSEDEKAVGIAGEENSLKNFLGETPAD